MTRFALYAAAIVAIVVGLAAVADALVLTDEERIEQLVDAFDGTISEQTLDEGLRFVETDREPVEVSLEGGQVEVYEDADARLTQRARDALRPLIGSEVEVLQHTIRVDEQDADVALRARTRYGVVDVTLDLTKHGERWLVWRARLR